jgi:hypothetical protein
MLFTLLLALFALGAPYVLLAFVELDPDPYQWMLWSRIVLALIYGFYVWLVLSALADVRKAPPKH